MRLTLAFVAIACGAWAILPDPVPIVIDDVAASVASAYSIIKRIRSFFSGDLK